MNTVLPPQNASSVQIGSAGPNVREACQTNQFVVTLWDPMPERIAMSPWRNRERQTDQVRRQILTIGDEPQPVPEGPGTPERRIRLYAECLRRVSGFVQSSPDSKGMPLGDGVGLEELVQQIRPIFARERSLIQWVALRGAISALWMTVLEGTDGSLSSQKYADLHQAMGIVVDNANDVWEVVPEWNEKLTDAQRAAVLGVAGSVMVRAEAYLEYSKLPTNEVLANPILHLQDAVALDCIVWCAVAMSRLGELAVPQFPSPDKLESPGWYPEPLFNKADRYWDGNDWTERCRVLRNGRFEEISVSLR
jgi:hypothetical protein